MNIGFTEGLGMPAAIKNQQSKPVDKNK